MYAIDRRGARFYTQIDSEFDVEIVRCDCRVRDMRRYVVDWLLGHSALILVRNLHELPRLFDRISELAVASLFVLNAASRHGLQELGQYTSGGIEGYVRRQPDHLLLIFAEGSADSNALIPGQLSLGVNCPEVLKTLVTTHFGAAQSGQSGARHE